MIVIFIMLRQFVKRMGLDNNNRPKLLTSYEQSPIVTLTVLNRNFLINSNY